MQADMHRLYDVAEKTTDDVRSIASAREEVGQTRATLETVLSMMTHVHDAANTLDHRKRQVEQAEERLARAETLLAEIQAGLAQLFGQKALLDQAATQAGSLEFHTKQAEVVIAALKRERETSEKVRNVVAPAPEIRRSEERPTKKSA